MGAAARSRLSPGWSHFLTNRAYNGTRIDLGSREGVNTTIRKWRLDLSPARIRLTSISLTITLIRVFTPPLMFVCCRLWQGCHL